MIVKHNSDKVISDVSIEIFTSFFKDSVSVINKLVSLHGMLVDFNNGIVSDDDMFDELDDLSIKINSIQLVSECRTSVVNSNNRYLINTVSTLERFLENVRGLVDLGRYPDAKDAEILAEQVHYVIGGLAYFMIYDFGIDQFLFKIADGVKSPDVDEVFVAYCKGFGVNPINFGKDLVEIHKAHKFKLDVFDECPELEEPFEKIMGPDYNIVPEGMLDIGLVKNVISGELALHELLQLFDCVEEE